MKRILLSALAVATLSVNAQDLICPNGFSEDFAGASATVGANDYGIWWWGKQDHGTDTANACASEAKCIASGVERTRSGNGDLVLKVNRARANWTPTGASIGSKVAFVNLTNAGAPLSNKVEIMLTNGAGSSVEVFFDFQSNGTTGADAEMVNADANGTSLGTGALAANESRTYTLDLSSAIRTSWALSEQNCLAKTNGSYAGGKCLYNAGFDVTKLSGLGITVVGLASAESNWEPLALVDQSVTIHSIKGGKSCVSNSDAVSELTTASKFKIFPSPANDVLNVNFEAQENVSVALTDITGRVVLSQNVSAGSQNLKFNVATFSEGMYFVTFTGAAGQHTEKVLVK